METYDLIIIGGSAAATTAGIYAARRGLKFKIVTKEFGGEVATSGEIGNWPGDGNTDGLTLSEKFKQHLKLYNIVAEEGIEVEKIERMGIPDAPVGAGGTFCITAKSDGVSMASDKLGLNEQSESKCDYTAKAVIVATGVHPKELNVPGEKQYRNKGVSYCTTCDGPLFSGKVTAVIGGGNSALEAGLMLSDIASKVYVINKNVQFKGDKVLIDNLSAKPNVEIIYSAMTKEIKGGPVAAGFVKSLVYSKEGEGRELPVDGVFVHIGNVPNSSVVPDEVNKNKFSEIMVDANCATNVPGLFAAGDVTDVPFKQIVIAAGQGTIAALSAVQYLNRSKI